jgi:hypothetical protein
MILDTHVSLAFGVGAILNVKSGKVIEIEQRAAGGISGPRSTSRSIRHGRRFR